MTTRQGSLWEQVGGKVSDNHPLTSHVAAARVKSGGQKAQGLIALQAVYPEGLTAFQLADHIVDGSGRNISRNQAATRLGEIRDNGWAELKLDRAGLPEQRTTTPGNTGVVYKLTDIGYRMAVGVHAEKRPQ